MWKLAFVLVAWIPNAFADVDKQFSGGALGLLWGATLQQVQSTYPGGLTWPVGSREIDGVAYVVQGSVRSLNNITTPVKLVQFIFTKKNELRGVYFHFSYADSDSALYDIAMMLGQDYSVKDDGMIRKYIWKSGKTTQALFESGTSASHPWALLGVQASKLYSARRY